MSAQRCFRRLLATICLSMLLLGVALVAPVLLNRLLSGAPEMEQGPLFACLFVPTLLDWPSHALGFALSAILGASLLLGLLSIARQWYRTRRLTRALLRFAMPAGGKTLLRKGAPGRIVGRIDLVDVAAPVAFCYGLARPRICVSTGALEGLRKREVAALLLHEYHHLLCRDPLKTAVSRVFANAFFFLPIVRALHEQYMLAKEIDADEYTLRIQGSDKPLLNALYKLLLKQPRHKLAGLALAGAGDAITLRLDYLLDGRLPAGPHPAAMFISSAVLAAFTAFVAFTTWTSLAGIFWQQAHSTLGSC